MPQTAATAAVWGLLFNTRDAEPPGDHPVRGRPLFSNREFPRSSGLQVQAQFRRVSAAIPDESQDRSTKLADLETSI